MSDDMQASFDQADAATLYEQMHPDQRTAIALEFVRCLRLTAQQAAAIHRYTYDHRPDCFTQVMRHPLTQAVLGAPGDAPATARRYSQASEQKERSDTGHNRRYEPITVQR
jgi:hypothetical protein